MAAKKKKLQLDNEEMGTPRLGDVEKEEWLVLRATQDDSTNERELMDRIHEAELETDSPELEAELRESKNYKKKKK